MDALRWLGTWIVRVLRFALRVAMSFLRNHGILLAGGVGYNTLLSLVPLLALAGAALSVVFDRERMLSTLHRELTVLVPQSADAIVEVVDSYLQHQGLTSVVSVVFLLFFSSMAFSMLEQAVAAIFHAHSAGQRRHPLLSFLIPYAFVAVLVLALFAITFVTTGLDVLAQGSTRSPTVETLLTWSSSAVFRVAGWGGLVVLFAGVYRVLPVVHIPLRKALIGGLCAAGLWQLVGRFLVYYFSTLSMVNLIYGSLATVVVLLLFLEIAVIILLLGAQVIAELEGSAAAGVHWWERPPASPAPVA